MTVKIIIRKKNAQGVNSVECQVLYAENGAALERRIKDILSNLEADGYKAKLLDCFNLEYPDMFQHP